MSCCTSHWIRIQDKVRENQNERDNSQNHSICHNYGKDALQKTTRTQMTHIHNNNINRYIHITHTYSKKTELHLFSWFL